MNSACKFLVLLLAGIALAGCGGGGGSDGHGATTPPQGGKLTLSATTTTLPLNPDNIAPYVGSPYMAEVGITFRSSNGTIMAPNGDATVTINPPSVATVSFPDDPATPENELAQRYVTFPITLNNGSNVIFVTAFDVAGTATLTVSANDPLTNQTVTSTLQFTVATGVGPMPASIDGAASPALIYAPSSGGRSDSMIRAIVRDAGGQLVMDPTAGNGGTDNVKFEILGETGGATLSTDSLTGAGSGTSVTTHTVRGVASASLHVTDATPQSTPLRIKITADGADNDVANGISTPIEHVVDVIVTDGDLYSVQITSPIFATRLPGITINRLPTAPGVEPVDPGDDGIPIDPDATLSLSVTAQASDRHGRPVVPGTIISFGLVDEPVDHVNYNNASPFLISGIDGNPQQNGNLFTAPDGQFLTAGGGAIPGDALVLFGKARQGYEDFESAHTVLSPVISQTRLNATPVFNYLNTTVAPGPVIPYLVGRSGNGNNVALDSSQGATDAEGRVHAKVNYKVRNVGDPFALWAQGNGLDRNHDNSRRLVADALVLQYPGVAPATLIAYPDPIPGNTSTTVFVCAQDALGIPLRGFPIGFAFDLPNGTGSVDGTSLAGMLAQVTGADGCALANVVTSGLAPSGGVDGSGTLNFTGAGASASVSIVVGAGFLSVSPPQLCATVANPRGVTVTSYSADGAPIGGVEISASCSAQASANPTTATTASNGSAVFEVQAEDDTVGTCTFSASGYNSITVNITGANANVSPPCI